MKITFIKFYTQNFGIFLNAGVGELDRGNTMKKGIRNLFPNTVSSVNDTTPCGCTEQTLQWGGSRMNFLMAEWNFLPSHPTAPTDFNRMLILEDRRPKGMT